LISNIFLGCIIVSFDVLYFFKTFFGKYQKGAFYKKSTSSVPFFWIVELKYFLQGTGIGRFL